MAILSETIPVGEWLPDRADLENQGCLVALNCIPDGEDYKPFPSFAGQTDTLAAQCYGGYDHVSSGGTITKFIATREKIYTVSGGTYTDVTNTGADYLTPSDGCWFFTQFGDRVIATNYVDKIQTYLVGTDTEFEDLIQSGPDVKCRNFGIINNFLVCGDIVDDDGVTPNRIRWSPINDPAGDWTPSQSTQSDYQNCEDGNPGAAMSIISGQNYGIIHFRRATYIMEYVGPPNIFSFKLIEQGRGPVNAQAVTWNGSDSFYRSDDGLYQFNGNMSIPIGERKTDKYFKDHVDETYLYNIRMTTDPNNKTVLLAYTSTAATNGRNDKILLYHWATQRFTEVDQACDFIYRGLTSGYTLEELGAEYPDIESVPYSLDSAFWAGGNSLLSGVVDDVLGYFQGEPMTAYLETQESRLNSDGMSYLQSVLPVYEGGTCKVRVGHRKIVNGSINYTPYVDVSDDTGEANFEIEARYHRAGVELTGDWSYFQGIRFRAEAGSGI